MKHEASIDAAAVRAVLTLLPAQMLINELARRLAALEQPAPAPHQPRRAASSAPSRRRARRRGRRRARSKDDATTTGASAPRRNGAQEGAVLRPLRLTRESSLLGFKFDVAAIVEGRATPPSGTINIAQAGDLLLEMRKFTDLHPQPKIARNAPKDLCAFRLARFLGIATANLERRLGLKSGRGPTGPGIKLGGNGSSIAPPSKARLMGGR